MAEILSQEEIDALLEVVDDNTDTPIASNSKDEKMKEISLYTILSVQTEFQKNNLGRLKAYMIN